MSRVWLLLVVMALCGCKVREEGLVVLATPEDAALIADGLAFIGDARIKVVTTQDPEQALQQRDGVVVALVDDDRCDDCFRVDGAGTVLTAKGGGVLGRQYALWHALELLGYRYVHARYTKVPETFGPVESAQLHLDHAPEMEKRRGLHLHTLHPIETLFDFWVPGEENLEGAKRSVDFLIKNRGNYLQWCALDDIVSDAELATRWHAHTTAITSFAHARGVKVGIAVQLFGQGNLQNAYDLIDDETAADPIPEVERRLHLLLDDSGFDAIHLSFGEFFAAEPAVFVAKVDAAYAAMQRVQAGVEVFAAIHVGNFDNLRVTYMGERQLYYFLVRYANPAIVPWVHTTMYFNLYEDAGLAYLHDQFDEHRAHIESRLRAGQTVGYYPESAYWVAFDINVPTFVPLYMRSRHYDQAKLREAGRLQDHTLFSSGWEWGYWLTDAMVLRTNYELPAQWQTPLEHFFAAWGAAGATAFSIVTRMADFQHQALIVERLAAYVAGRDQLIDGGESLGIVSQPDRPQFTELMMATQAEREAFRSTVLARLDRHASELEQLAREAQALPTDDRVMAELVDGVQVTAARVRFIHSLYKAVLDRADGQSDEGALGTAESALQQGTATVAKRRRAMWDPKPQRLLFNTKNPTFYQYGYLREADTLCFWKRERAQVLNLLKQAGEAVPGCVL